MNFSRTTRKLRPVNMVSLIDIVFTIILFFLVTGHIESSSRLPVELPKAEAGQPLEEGPMVVTLGKYGEVAINDQRVELGSLAPIFAQAFAATPEQVITLKADALLEANRLVDLMETIRKAGGKHVAIMTDSSGAQREER